MPDELTHADHAVSAAADALVADVVATVRNHPEYANAVNQLADQALRALLAGL